MTLTLLERLRQDIKTHGEVHATIEEVESLADADALTVELRKGTVTVEDDYLTVETNDTIRRIAADRIVTWYKPREFIHEEH